MLLFEGGNYFKYCLLDANMLIRELQEIKERVK